MKDNKLIAEWMGAKWNANALRYHLSWDWLMPVFDKMTSSLDVAWKITSKGVEIHNHNQGFELWVEINCPENVIKDAHKAVVEFIRYQNKEDGNKEN